LQYALLEDFSVKRSKRCKMTDIYKAAREFHEMDELAERDSAVHLLHPLVKLIVTIIYILITVSFHKYDLYGLTVMILYPVIMLFLSDVSVRICFYKLRFVLPLICAVGIINPFFDRSILLHIGGLTITGGVLSMFTLMLKGVLCLMASFILAATTSIDLLCGALRKIHVPGIIVTLILLTYRYVSVMMEEVSVMTTAYRLRAPGQNGIHVSAWGSFLGQLLLRSMDKAEELYISMQLRGFNHEFYYADSKTLKFSDILFCTVAVVVFVVCRLINIPVLLGGLFV